MQKTYVIATLQAEVPYEGMAQLVTTVTVPYAYDGSGAKKKKRTVTAYYRQDEEKTFVHTCDQNL